MRLFWPTVDMLIEAPAFVAPPGLCLDPSWFPALGPPPAGKTTLDTGTLQADGLEGRGVLFQQGIGEPEIAIFAFAEGTLSGEVILRGPRPAALLFQGAARVCARIDARRAGARREGPGLAASPGAGGGFGGRGGASAGDSRGGPSYGLTEAFEVGSGGQHGASPGGLGGGGVQIGALGGLELCGAWIDADGQAGLSSRDGIAGGGGSGGTVILHGAHVRLDPRTVISVRGGNGGDGALAGGGGGAGGHVLGVSESEGRFDPRGTRFVPTGGRGGRGGNSGSGGASREGCGGEHGVVYLAARRAVLHDPLRVGRAGRSPRLPSESDLAP